ncbi:MAG: tRNA adenylyltransferase, partial [Candidatus Paceibacterota bacterium]
MVIPKEVKSVLKKLAEKGYEAYIVGGCVRDLLRGIEPKDWDVTTSA